jgi:orotidine-5'-phosphate decarboxylase
MKFIDKLKDNLSSKNSHVCVGLDSQHSEIPKFMRTENISEDIFNFNKKVIEQTADIAVIYKMNVSFYAGFGAEGLKGLELTNKFIKKEYPNIQIFADCKRSEMGGSVEMVKKEIFDWLKFDCVMVTPWFGFDTMKDYFKDETKGIMVYVHDSNPTASEIQDLILADGRCVYEEVARKVSAEWNFNGNLIAEAGATYLPQLRKIRGIIGEEMPLLVAGVGTQGGKAEDLTGLFGTNKQRLIVNSSRGIIFENEATTEDLYFQNVRAKAEKLRNDLLAVAGN